MTPHPNWPKWLPYILQDPTRLPEVVKACFLPGGPLARAGRQVRSCQIDMACRVAHLLVRVEAPHPLALEAPTGTGKTWAYGVPVLIEQTRQAAHLGKLEFDDGLLTTTGDPEWTAILSTKTKTLQAQLLADLPDLATLLGLAPRIQIKKSLSNYFCRLAYAASGRDDRVEDLLHSSWGQEADLDELPAGLSWARRFNITPSECLGHTCDFASSCPALRAKARAAKADILVTNHAYLARARSWRAQVLVVDEAHTLEGVLRDAQSISQTRESWNRVERHIPDAAGYQLGQAVDSLHDRLEAALASGGGKAVRLKEGWPAIHTTLLSPARACQLALADKLRGFGAEVEDNTPPNAVILHAYTVTPPPMAARKGTNYLAIKRALGTLRRLVNQSLIATQKAIHEGWVAELDLADSSASGGNEEVEFGVTAIDVGPAFGVLTKRMDRIVLTSATLPSFAGMSAILGCTLPDADRLDSPYPLRQMGYTVIPNGPSPAKNNPAWPPWAVSKVVEAVTRSGGGVLILSSSRKMAKRYYDAVVGTGFPVRLQERGASVPSLVRWMKEASDRVLVGVETLGVGVDIQGPSLRGVVVDRIPFVHQDDLVEQAVTALVAQRTKRSGFWSRSLPQAAARLGQWAGRLIRSEHDRGFLLVLDPRVLRWKPVLDRLPPFARTSDMAVIDRVPKWWPMPTSERPKEERACGEPEPKVGKEKPRLSDEALLRMMRAAVEDLGWSPPPIKLGGNGLGEIKLEEVLGVPNDLKNLLRVRVQDPAGLASVFAQLRSWFNSAPLAKKLPVFAALLDKDRLVNLAEESHFVTGADAFNLITGCVPDPTWWAVYRCSLVEDPRVLLEMETLAAELDITSAGPLSFPAPCFRMGLAHHWRKLAKSRGYIRGGELKDSRAVSVIRNKANRFRQLAERVYGTLNTDDHVLTSSGELGHLERFENGAWVVRAGDCLVRVPPTCLQPF